MNASEIKCPSCQQGNRDGAQFCRHCGSLLATPCPVCGTRLSVGARFCDSCGAPLSAGRLSRSAPGSPLENSYGPTHLAKGLLTSKAAFEGERKQVTVLFADMKGSTEQVADRDPHGARQLLDPMLERMMEAVQLYEGTVNQVMGDGIMGLFGAPLAYEDHAVRACYAALKMQDLIRRYADEVRRKEGILLQVRIGLNSGEVVVRSIGNELHMNYTAMGQTTHLAARMEQMAIPGSILITSHTLRLAEGYVVAKPLGPMPVKGLTTPIETYELVGANELRSRIQVAAARGLSRFVGRGAETDQLRAVAEHARQGFGQAVAVVGEAGVGKSRLIHEFADQLLTSGWTILEAGAVSHGPGSSYLPVTDLLKQYFEIGASDDAAAVRERLTKKLLGLDEALLPLLPTFLTLLDVPADEFQPWSSEPPQHRQRTMEALKRLLFTASQSRPLLVVLEDLQWMDPETVVMIDELAAALSSCQFVLLLSYRSDYRHAWESKAFYTVIRIDPLGPESSREMLDALVGDGEGLDPLKQLLIEKTEGNPFFLEESVRTLLETGVLTANGGYRVTKSVSSLQIPETLESLLTARMDRLSPGDKRILQVAAVIGNPVPLTVLQAIAELPNEELRAALGRLQRLELLYEAKLFPEVEYSFKHALIHDVAYQTLPPDRQLQLHSLALAAGEQAFVDRMDEMADWLAFHAVRAKAWERAITHLQAAAARAISRAANRVAVQHLEDALVAIDHLPDQNYRELAVDLRIRLRHALTPLGQVERTLDHLRNGERLAMEQNERSKLGWIVSFTTNCLVLQARYAEALLTGARALEIARELDDRRLELASEMYVARARLSRGEFAVSTEIWKRIIRSVDQADPDDFLGLPVLPASFARSNLAACLAEMGSFEDASVSAIEASRRAKAAGQPDSIMWGDWSIGLVALMRGRPAEAVTIFDRLFGWCEAHDLDAYKSRVMAGLGSAKARLGEVKEGLALLERAVALDAAAEPQTTRSFALAALAEALLLAADFERALEISAQALGRARRHEERSAEAYASLLAANIRVARGVELDLAANGLSAAKAIAAELGMKPLLAHCELGLGELSARQGRERAARAHRQAAQHLFDTLGMKPWFQVHADSAPDSRSVLRA